MIAVGVIPPGIKTGGSIVKGFGVVGNKGGWGWVQRNFVYITRVIQITITLIGPQLSIGVVIVGVR